MKSLSTLSGLFLVLTTSSLALAQAKPAPAPAGGPQAAPTGAAPAPAAAPKADASDPVERARQYYERGLQLFNEENYDAALFEFERAYELAPSFKILYNMGRIQRQQNNYAAAIRSYERYLREGGASIPDERKAEVEKELSILRPRVAEVSVTVNVDDADVYADDIPVCAASIESTCVGKSPLKSPILLNGGRHKITATKKGYVTATSIISVVGSDKLPVKLELVSLDRPLAQSNPWKVPTFVGWGVTGAGLITAGVFAVLAQNASSDQEDKVNQLGATRAELDDAKDKTNTLGQITDGFLIGSAVAAGVSAYFTIRMIGWKNEKSNANVTVGGNNVMFTGRF